MHITTFDEATKMSNERSFDTLRYANRLKAAGVPEKQAEVQAEMMAETIEDKLATKKDLKELELRIILKLGSMIVGSLGTLVVLMKLLSYKL
ncbi:MAG: DUF1640 domain-containing protein [bacterium]